MSQSLADLRETYRKFDGLEAEIWIPALGEAITVGQQADHKTYGVQEFFVLADLIQSGASTKDLEAFHHIISNGGAIESLGMDEPKTTLRPAPKPRRYTPQAKESRWIPLS